MKNKFTIENAAMLLIDHQQGTIKLARNLPYEEIVQNTRALTRTAIETRMPIVLTSSMKDHFQGLLLDDLQKIAPDAYEKRVKRPGLVDCWEYEPYKNAVLATGRKKLIMSGLTNDVCIVYPAISAVEDGFEVQVVVDAGGCVSGYKGFSEIGPYSVSKHAVLGLTKVAALKYAKDNIQITSISPGGVDTPMLRYAREAHGLTFEEGSKAIPIGRTNTVEEMARAVMFLTSDEASAFHGSLVDVTSGMLDGIIFRRSNGKNKLMQIYRSDSVS